MAKKKAKQSAEVDLSAVLNQLAQLTTIVQGMVEDKPAPKKKVAKTTKKAVKKKVKVLEEDSDEEVDQENLFSINPDKKPRGRLITKAKCKPTDIGSDKEEDKIKYPKRKKTNKRPQVEVKTEPCIYCQKPLPRIEGLMQDYACAKCLIGG